MEITAIKALRGPNLWSKHPSIQAIVNCTEDEMAINRIENFEKRLRTRFSQIRPLKTAAESDTSLACVLELVALDLQTQAGCPVSFSLHKKTINHGEFQIVFEYSQENVGRLALEQALALCTATLNDTPFDADKAIQTLRDLDEDTRFGPSTGAIVNAAIAHNIPISRMTEGSMVRLGWGVKQRRIRAAETDQTSAIAESIAQNKQLTKNLLAAAFIPVPAGRPVDDFEECVHAAAEIGFPVVIKPLDGNQGKGVTVNITSHEALEAAFKSAKEYGDELLLEKYITGNDFRLLVIGNRLVAAARRDPAKVIGNGVNSISELVDQINQDPRRSDGHATSLTKIRIDDIALACLNEQGLTPSCIPAVGKTALLRKNANLSTGGSATDVTDDVHPTIAAQAITAASMIGLDIAGIDLICEDVIHPIEEQGGGIVEVNAAPGLRMHLEPSYGKGRAVGEAIISTLFNNHENGRVPIVAITGTNGKTTTAKLIAHIFSTKGLCVGSTGTDGVRVGERIIDTGDCSGPKSAQKVLWHPNTEAAVLEVARGGLLREGLAFDVCDVSVVTNLGLGDHLGLNHINTVDELAILKRVIVQNTSASGFSVLNADDPKVAEMALGAPCEVIFFSQNPALPIMATRKAQGKPVVYLQNEAIVLAKDTFNETFALANIPFTFNGVLKFQVENAMAAIAAAWGAGIDAPTIREALKTFSTNQNAKGRFNMFQYKGGTIIADYGHNPDAMLALVDTIKALPAKRRSVVISAAGDRRDQDIILQTKILAGAFDHAILFEDQCQRGRKDGEVIQLLRQGVAASGRSITVTEIQGEFKAIEIALRDFSDNDLCLILVDQVQEAIDFIKNKISNELLNS